MKFEALDKELQDLLYSRDNSKLISVLKEGKNPLHLEQLAQLDVKSCKNLGFPVLWELYENDFIPFEEDFLIEKLCDALVLMSKHKEIESFILKKPRIAKEIGEKLPSYFLEKRHIYVTEYEKLLDFGAKGFFKGTQVVPNFLESLLSPMKTYTASTYCDIIESCKSTAEELLPSQQTLFALLSSDKTSVINFVMKLIKQIADEKDFDFQSFADNFALCFTTQKIAKSQLIGLNILEKHYQKQAPTNPDYREQLAVLFTVPDVKLQEKVVALLTTYFNHEGLPEVIDPYSDYLKGKALELFSPLSPAPIQNDNLSSQLTDCSPSEKSVRVAYAARLETPTTPEALLFLLGDCLRERTPQTIDLFFEGFNQLQDDFPADFKEQLAPYLKQLDKHWNGIASVPILRWFLQRWTGDKKKLNKEDEEFFLSTLPYLYHKAQHLLENRKKKNRLPFLSTPTHAPFYIEAEVLVDKLLQYEAQGKAPDLDDLIVACNRLLFWEVSAAAKEKAQQLKGDYAPAIQYYLGLTDKIQLNEALLPLWTQITRLKHPDEEFKVFENTQAKNILSVVKPFYIRYGWEKRTYANGEVGEEFTYHCNHYYKYKNKKSRPTLYNYYNANEGEHTSAQEAEYKLSLNPHYPDAILCAYIALWATMNEADQVRDMTLPLEAVLRYDLRVRHSGWLYIGACLLFEKRPSRDLAYEYICQAIARGEDLTHLKTYLANVLAWDYLPIPRFIEFLDRPNPPAVKAFGKEVVELYLEEVKKQDKLPRNHKKLATFSH